MSKPTYKFPIFCWCAYRKSVFENSGFWFRICGYGLSVSTRGKEHALFSERYGYKSALYMLGLRFEVLKP